MQNRGNYSAYRQAPPDLDSLVSTLQGQLSNSQWYQFGMNIGVPQWVLNKLEHYPEEHRLAKMLSYWLEHHSGQPTWKEITDAQKQFKQENDVSEYSEYL